MESIQLHRLDVKDRQEFSAEAAMRRDTNSDRIIFLSVYAIQTTQPYGAEAKISCQKPL